MSDQHIHLIQTIWDDERAIELRTQQVAEVAERYRVVEPPSTAEPAQQASASSNEVPATPEPLPSQILLSLLAVRGEGETSEAVGYIGAVIHELEPQPTAELRRLYVRPDHRGQGISRQLMGEAERLLAAQGFTRLVLESGTKQPESLALYESSGYERIANYGFYKDSDTTISYAKNLRR